jgi:hypothetical protein
VAFGNSSREESDKKKPSTGVTGISIFNTLPSANGLNREREISIPTIVRNPWLGQKLQAQASNTASST